ncbi:MAG: DUF6514 family protein [Oscillospiraceae bacterium]|jgi:hypothetical protein|nr:DUF6514 family protein [Oscillospiraceae bacterium]
MLNQAKDVQVPPEVSFEMIYRVFEETLSDPSAGEYHTYGIEAAENGESRRIADISLNRREVEELAELFNREELDPAHFHDAVEDFFD